MISGLPPAISTYPVSPIPRFSGDSSDNPPNVEQEKTQSVSFTQRIKFMIAGLLLAYVESPRSTPMMRPLARFIAKLLVGQDGIERIHAAQAKVETSAVPSETDDFWDGLLRDDAYFNDSILH